MKLESWTETLESCAEPNV